MKQCPCGSGKAYPDCCGKFIEHNEIPSTPEELMRSRYSAFAIHNLLYIEKTMKSPAADNFSKDSPAAIKWLKLEVINSSVESNNGYVEFIAYYSDHGRMGALHEKSKFKLEDGRWYYTDGLIIETPAALKIGRNSPCICGSGKKFKKCCQMVP